MSTNYFKERNHQITQRTRNIRKQLPSFCDSFFTGIEGRTSALTKLNYSCDLRIFFDFLFKEVFTDKTISSITISDLDKLTAMDFEQYLEYLNYYEFRGKKYSSNEKAKQRKLCSLRTFYKYYYKKGLISANPTANVDLPKIHEKDIIRLEIDEVVKLLNLAEDGDGLTKHAKHFHAITGKRDLTILTLFLGTGMRISELVGLNRTDIDFSAYSLKVTRKGGNQVILYFGEEVCQALKEYLMWIDSQETFKVEDKDALFVSMKGSRISLRAVQNLVKKYASIVSPLKNISPHKLRSTYGTNLYRETKDIYVVANVLGHKDVNTTKKHYAAISDEIRRNAANVVKLRDKTE